MMLRDLNIGDKVVFDGEIWTFKDVVIDQMDNTKAWVTFVSLIEPEFGHIFEAWPLDKEVFMIKNIPTDELKLNPHRPSRTKFALEELAESVRAHGIVQPLIVLPDGMVLDGSDRLRVARIIGIKEVPCLVRNLTPEQALEFSITHSKSHVPTEPKEYQAALKRLLQMNPGLTIEELARRIEKPVEWVQEKLNANN